MQKLVLTEAEKVFLMAWFDQTAWGAFSLVSNLGSLVLRLLFAPLEDVAFSSFSRASVEESRPLLQTLIGIQGTIGMLAALLGPLYSYVVVYILYGEAWISAVPTLRVYCIFLFFSALNGVLEAYCFSTAHKRWLTVNQAVQIATSLTMCTLCYALRDLGPVSLVTANTVCMALRIIRCCTWVRESLGLGAVIHEVMPKIALVAASVSAVSALIIFVVPGTAMLESLVPRSVPFAKILPLVVLGAIDVLLIAVLLIREGKMLVGALKPKAS